jgi:hypothetical protein
MYCNKYDCRNRYVLCGYCSQNKGISIFADTFDYYAKKQVWEE